MTTRNNIYAIAGCILILLSAFISVRYVNGFVPYNTRCSRIQSSTSTSTSTVTYMFDSLKNKDQETNNSNDESSSQQAATTEEEEEEEAEEKIDDFSDDPVDKIFSFFFGKKEESPMGMKRFGREKFPEQYPAVLDEWAEPVTTDDKDMKLLRPLLKNTNLEFRGLKLTYSSNRDGWNPIAFHKKVDKLGGGIVVCTTTDGLVCGGYNPKGWVGYGEARGSIAAFLFVFRKGITELPFKLRKTGGPSFAQNDLPEIGPSFGADSLVIPLEKSNPKIARSKLGSYFERFPDGTNTLFGKRGASVQLKEFNVYHGVYEEGEYIPFTDAEPFALY